MSVDNPAPKGQEDSARGFNPGYGKPRGAALKVAVETSRPGVATSIDSPTVLPRTPNLAPLQGASRYNPVPGVKTPG
jgi:hypothetical protein